MTTSDANSGEADLPGRPTAARAAVLGTALADALPARLTAAGGEPFLTFLDHSTDERTELSVATIANWASKFANLLLAELDEGATVGLRTDGHWAASVTAIGAWRVGMCVRPLTVDATTPASAERLVVAHERWSRPDDLVVGAGLGGRPAPGTPGRPFVEEVLAEPDDLDADPPDPDAPAVRCVGAHMEAEVAGDEVDLSVLCAPLAAMAGRRTLLLEPLDSPVGLVALAAAVVHRGSLVALRAPEAARLPGLVESERVQLATGRGPDLPVERVAVPTV